MNDDKMELAIPTTQWHSNGDEENFFRWLYSIKGYVTCQGQGKVLYVTISIADVDRRAILELLALFRRYNIPEIRQLQPLVKSKHGNWFCDPKNYWHSDVFS